MKSFVNAPLFYTHSYVEQLIWKSQNLKDHLFSLQQKRVKKYKENESLSEIPIIQVIPSPKIVCYRNKTTFSIGYKEEKKIAVGFSTEKTKYLQNETQEVTEENIGDNPLVDETDLKARALLIDWMRRNQDFPAYSKTSKFGLWRSVTIRKEMKGEKNLLLIFKVNPSFCEERLMKSHLKDLWSFLEGESISGVLLDNSNDQSTVLSHRLELVGGRNSLEYQICGMKIHCSAGSFFQVNLEAAELLYERILKNLEEILEEENARGKRVAVFDLFCGVGTLGVLIANKFPQIDVFSVDKEEGSIEDAKLNCKRNVREENLTLYCSDINSKDDQLFSFINPSKYDFTIAVLDPPRSGLTQYAIERLMKPEMKLRHIQFVSCHQQNFVHNAFRLCSKFNPTKSYLVDLFPQTKSYESLVSFERKN